MDRKRVFSSSSFPIDLFMPSSAASYSSSPNSYAIDDDDNHRVKLPKEANDVQEVPGVLNILEEVVLINENDDMPQDAIIVGSKGKIEADHSVIKLKGSFGIDAACLSPDSLAYLDLNSNAGDMAGSIQSVDSNYSDQISEDMEVEDDSEPTDMLEDGSWMENIFEHDQNPSSSLGPNDNTKTTVQVEINKRKFREFKQFDTIVGHSDHYFAQNTGKDHLDFTSRRKPLFQSGLPPSKEWIKQIQHEWSILETDLPDSIFVRAYEERMELLRAVIIGASGTPYQDGLFFFDILFRSDYPHTPPHFESFVVGHFMDSAPRILEACQAYIAGAQIGSLTPGSVQDEVEGDKTFRNTLSQFFPQLVVAFTYNGADCQKFLPKPKEPRERKIIPKIWN